MNIHRHLILLLITHLLNVATGRDCGFPGRPGNGTAKSVEKFFYPSEEVEYLCDDGFVLFGDRRRTCQENGIWSGGLPECSYNMALKKTTSQSETLWSYNAELAVDGDGNTCSFTPQSDVQRWWQVHLEGSPHVGSVAITMSPGSYQHFTIFVVELLEGNKAMYKPCSKFEGRFQDQKILFKCNEEEGHSGQFVYIRDDREDKEYFGLCEVEVFEHKGHPGCGEPEQPIYGLVKTTKGNAYYSCIPGYILKGNASRTCSWGGWDGQVPECVEVQCDHPSSTKDGFIEVSNFKGSYVYGSRATYHCNPGFILWGNATRLCNAQGKWTGETPQCQPIACGDPITFPHASVAMLNGSTVWKAVAQYTCIHGYNRIAGNSSSNRNNNVIESRCLQNGSWTKVHLTCVQNPAFMDPRYGPSHASNNNQKGGAESSRIGLYGSDGRIIFGSGSGALTMISILAAVILGTGTAAVIILIRGWCRKMSNNQHHRHMIISGESAAVGTCFDSGRSSEDGHHKYSDLANTTTNAVANQYGTLTLVRRDNEPCYETTTLSTFRGNREEHLNLSQDYSSDEGGGGTLNEEKSSKHRQRKRKRIRPNPNPEALLKTIENPHFIPPPTYLEPKQMMKTQPQQQTRILIPLSEENLSRATTRIPSPPHYVNLRSIVKDVPSYATLNRRHVDAVPDILRSSSNEESRRQTRTLPHPSNNRELLSVFYDSPHPTTEKRVIINELSTFLETPIEIMPNQTHAN
ncbi:uncharacterized protein [Lepeophtheirus salmonis]|uniref:uncharacterized protein n=1 Tax=Lepeophtheirus salmonis TaxID=72036 RepID=UPI003AF375F9